MTEQKDGDKVDTMIDKVIALYWDDLVLLSKADSAERSKR